MGVTTKVLASTISMSDNRMEGDPDFESSISSNASGGHGAPNSVNGSSVLEESSPTFRTPTRSKSFALSPPSSPLRRSTPGRSASSYASTSLAASASSATSGVSNPPARVVPGRTASAVGRIDWRKDVSYAIQCGRWETVKGNLSLRASLKEASIANGGSGSGDERPKKSSFWRRLQGKPNNPKDGTGLLSRDPEGRTPLHIALTSRKTPADIIDKMIDLEPKAVAVSNQRGRLPLHFAIVHKHPFAVISKLVNTYPDALTIADSKGQSALSYAMDIAKRETDLRVAPRTFWMPVPDNCEEATWQMMQGERWGIAHLLLLTAATNQITTPLSVNGKKPMLVDALLHGAPPEVIALLIGASSVLLTYDNKASAFAGSTLYTCLARHYPLSILISLAMMCPKDVYKVRDETGMGLVSALFISGCFEQVKATQDWTVAQDFYAAILETIEEGEMDEDPAFVDWWTKIEFLLAFCTCASGYANDLPTSYPRPYLLHAALTSVDTPPLVVRVLLALYPRSIALPDRQSGALPLHLAAQTREYVPRNYELQITGSESVLEIVLDADSSAVNCRHEQRLPLHYAIDSGRMFSGFKHLVEHYQAALRMRDPKTGLYPFQQAAAYSNRSDDDSARWTCVARNKYSHVVWKGLSDRQKASAVIKVSEAEDVERISTVYELLRREPGVVSSTLPVQSESVKISRDSSGMGLIAGHFVAWCFVEVSGRWEINEQKAAIFQRVLDTAKAEGTLDSATPEFKAWWTRMIFWIRYCCQRPAGADDATVDVPHDNDSFLLHAALKNSDTPPQVIELLLSLYPSSVSLSLPGTSVYPLHISAETLPYAARPFETVNASALLLTLQAFPGASRVTCEGRLPLHIAIAAGKTWTELACLVEEEPRALTVKDPRTGLYPFQLIGELRTYTTEQRMRFQHLARNAFDNNAWMELTPQARAKEVRSMQREYQLSILDCTFCLLRRSTSLIAQLRNESVSEEDTVHSESSTSIDIEDSSEEEEVDDSDFSAGDDSSTTIPVSENETDEETFGPGRKAARAAPSALTRLLSQSKPKEKDDELFECDASVFSNLDVMSTLSSTVHMLNDSRRVEENNRRATDSYARSDRASTFRAETENIKEDSDDNAANFDDSDSSSSGEFATDSQKVEDSAALRPDDQDSVHEGSLNASQDDAGSEVESLEDEERSICFMMRRVPRRSLMNQRFEAVTNVRLSKKPSSSPSAEKQTPDEPQALIIPTAQLSSSEENPKVLKRDSVGQSQSVHSMESDGFHSFHADELSRETSIASEANATQHESLLEKLTSSDATEESGLFGESFANSSKRSLGSESFMSSMVPTKTGSDLLGDFDSDEEQGEEDLLLPTTDPLTSYRDDVDLKTTEERSDSMNGTISLPEHEDLSSGPEVLTSRNQETSRPKEVRYTSPNQPMVHTRHDAGSLSWERSSNSISTKKSEGREVYLAESVSEEGGITQATHPRRRKQPEHSLFAEKDSSDQEAAYSPGKTPKHKESVIDVGDSSKDHSPVSFRERKQPEHTLFTQDSSASKHAHANEQATARTSITGVAKLSEDDRRAEKLRGTADVTHTPSVRASALGKEHCERNDTTSDSAQIKTRSGSSGMEHPRGMIPRAKAQPSRSAPSWARSEVTPARGLHSSRNQRAVEDEMSYSQSENTVEERPTLAVPKLTPQNAVKSIYDLSFSSSSNHENSTTTSSHHESSTANHDSFRTQGTASTADEDTEIYFDKKTMRWNRRPKPATVSAVESIVESTAESMAESATDDDHTIESHYSSGQKEEMYFDKKNMRWRSRVVDATADEVDRGTPRNGQHSSSSDSRQRAVTEKAMRKSSLPLKLTSGPETGVHRDSSLRVDSNYDMNCPSTPVRVARRSSYTGATSPKSGSPFVEMVSPEQIKRRNQQFAIGTRSGGPVTPKRSGAGKASPPSTPRPANESPTQSTIRSQRISPTKQLKRLSGQGQSKVTSARSPARSPMVGDVRSSWKSMFSNSGKQLLCLVCNHNGREVLMIPCRHLCICRDCSVKTKDIDTCPICDRAVASRMLIF